METEPSLFDLVNDEVTGVWTAVKPVGELKEIFELFDRIFFAGAVSQSVDLGRSNNPNTTPTKDYEKVRVVVYLRGVQRACAEEGERGSTPTG